MGPIAFAGRVYAECRTFCGCHTCHRLNQSWGIYLSISHYSSHSQEFVHLPHRCSSCLTFCFCQYMCWKNLIDSEIYAGDITFQAPLSQAWRLVPFSLCSKTGEDSISTTTWAVCFLLHHFPAGLVVCCPVISQVQTLCQLRRWLFFDHGIQQPELKVYGMSLLKQGALHSQLQEQFWNPMLHSGWTLC